MHRRHLPLNSLRAFEAAAKHCHMRHAAEELGVTHGAISRQVKQLEDQIGVKLFVREHNRLELTSAGERLYKSTSAAYDVLADSLLHLDPDSLRGPLVIASTQSIISTWLIAMVGEFSVKFPEIELRLLNIQPLANELKPDVDVAICYGRPETAQREVSTLLRERYFPVCSPSLIRPDQVIEKPNDLLNYPLLCDQLKHWQKWLAQFDLDISLAKKTLYIQQSFDVVSAAKQGFGIGMADRIEVSQALKDGTLVAPIEQSYEAEHKHYLVMDMPDKASVRARLFADYLRASLNQLSS